MVILCLGYVVGTLVTKSMRALLDPHPSPPTQSINPRPVSQKSDLELPVPTRCLVGLNSLLPMDSMRNPPSQVAIPTVQDVASCEETQQVNEICDAAKGLPSSHPPMRHELASPGCLDGLSLPSMDNMRNPPGQVAVPPVQDVITCEETQQVNEICDAAKVLPSSHPPMRHELASPRCLDGLSLPSMDNIRNPPGQVAVPPVQDVVTCEETQQVNEICDAAKVLPSSHPPMRHELASPGCLDGLSLPSKDNMRNPPSQVAVPPVQDVVTCEETQQVNEICDAAKVLPSSHPPMRHELASPGCLDGLSLPSMDNMRNPPSQVTVPPLQDVVSWALLKYFGARTPTGQNEELGASTGATDMAMESDEEPSTSSATCSSKDFSEMLQNASAVARRDASETLRDATCVSALID
uniref:Uncharacterized protein n=1 Tax=Larimichthys crocea TaxID=215358 RepID=A0A0F8C895_LARCR